MMNGKDKGNSAFSIHNSELIVPEIRFNGFSGEWESRALGDSVSYIKGFAFKSNDYEAYGTRIVRVSDLARNSLSESSSKIYINNNKANLYSKYIINDGDIVITTVGSKAEMRESAVGRAIIFTKNEGHLLNQNLVKVTPTINNDSQFIYDQLLRERYANFIEDIQRGNANQANIAIGDLWEYSLNFPKVKEEQNQIGNYFQKLDSLINQHQQKHEKLSNIKKAMLELMFPKQGENIPEIRFKGFSGEWEEVRIGDMVNCFSGGTPLVGIEEYYKGDIPFIRSAEINKTSTELRISESGLKNSSAKIVEVGTVLYALYGATSGEVGRARLRGAINQAILAIIPKDEMCPEFLSHWFRKSKGSIVNTYLQGGQGNLSGDIVKNLVLRLPELKEQTAIGNYFQKLDTLINQHQQQITKLNNIKQACLSKMFAG